MKTRAGRVLLWVALINSLAAGVPISLAQPTLRQLYVSPLEVGNSTPLSAPLYTPQGFLIATSFVQNLQVGDGKRRWLIPLVKYQPRGLLSLNRSVVVAEAEVYALALSDGRRIWTFRAPGNFSGCVPLHLDRWVIVGNDQHRIIALDEDSGIEQWESDLDPGSTMKEVVTGLSHDHLELFVSITTPGFKDGIASSGYLVCLDAATRAKHWIYRTTASSQGSGITDAALVTEKMVVVVDGISNAIGALDKVTGVQQWLFRGDVNTAGISALPLLSGGIIYVGSGDRNVYALRLDSGVPLWRTATGSSVSSIGLCGETILVVGGTVSAINLQGRPLGDTFPSLTRQIALSQVGAWPHGLIFSDAASLHVLQCS